MLKTSFAGIFSVVPLIFSRVWKLSLRLKLVTLGNVLCILVAGIFLPCIFEALVRNINIVIMYIHCHVFGKGFSIEKFLFKIPIIPSLIQDINEYTRINLVEQNAQTRNPDLLSAS